MCALGLCMHKMAGSAHGGNPPRNCRQRTSQVTDTESSLGRVADTSDLFDPVSQRMLPAATAIASVHRGRIYYFEDRANRDAFETGPEKYLNRSQPIGQKVGLTGESGNQSHRGHGCCG